MLNDAQLDALRAAVAADPARRGLRLQLAGALVAMGRSDEALVEARALLAVNPTNVEALGIATMAASLLGQSAVAQQFSIRLEEARSAVRWSDPSAAPVPVQAELPGPSAIIPLLGLPDLEGMADEKRRVHEVFLRPAIDRHAPRAGQPPLPSGLVLYGPPSCGKSLLAQAVAGELGVLFVSIDVAAAVDPWGAEVGDEGTNAIAEAFAVARDRGPCVLHLDNIEAAGHRRLRYTASGRRVLTELCAALDERDPRQVMVIAGTSAPWMLNMALRRAGRLDRMLLVGPPERSARLTMLQRAVQASGIACGTDLHALADRTEGCTNDDLRRLVASAAQFALGDSTLEGSVLAVKDRHVRLAIEEAPRSGRAWFDMAYNFPEFTDDSVEFDPLYDYIRRFVRRPAL